MTDDRTPMLIPPGGGLVGISPERIGNALLAPLIRLATFWCCCNSQ